MSHELSIVIPTYNRRERLRACIEALTRQTQPDFEVIVVVDGSTDGSVEMLKSLSLPFELHIVAQENAGYGAARNRGVEAASGRYVLFLDDDVVATPDLVAKHLRALREHDGAVVIGPYPQLLPPRAGRFARNWAELRSEYYRALEHRTPTFGACHTGNLSLPRDVFWSVGGFAVDLPRAVDIELGYRLEQSGVRFVFEPRALGFEDQRETSNDMIADAELRGSNALELWRRHPGLIARTLLGGRGEMGRNWVGLRLALLKLRVPPRWLDLFGYALPRGSLARRWYSFLYAYCYWRGFRRAVPDPDTWKRLVRGTPILMYHAVGGPSERASRYVVPRRRFQRHMRWLGRRGYHVMRLDELVSCLLEHRLPPAKSVVITFDDGYQDVRDHAVPLLESLDFPATVFLVTSAGSAAGWSEGSYSTDRSLITPADAGGLSNGLISFGAHTRTHRDLTSLSPAEVEQEVRGSRRELEAALGVPITAFAYPYGKWNPDIGDTVRRAGFLAACTMESGRNRLAADPFALRRLEVRGTDSVFRFALTLMLGDTHSVFRRSCR